MQGTDGKRSSSKRKLEFVLVNEPVTRAARPEIVKRVRSHVTKLQHQRTREQIIARRKDVDRTQSTSSGLDSTKSVAGNGSTSNHTVLSGDESAHIHNEVSNNSAKSKRGDLPEVLVRLLLGDPEISVVQDQMSFRTFAIDDPTNTVGMCVNELGFDISSILEYYKLMVQIQGRDFETQYGEAKNTVWKRFFRFIFGDPVLLTMALVLTIRYRLEAISGHFSSHDATQVLRLETYLISRINLALDDSIRALSDPMLVAVALCAAYGLKSGDLEACHVHMTGLVQMIRKRGGLDAIGRQDVYLERMLMWQDVNTAKMLSQEGYLEHMQNSMGSARPGSNVATFRNPF